jgi:PAS domain-containing protein
MSVREIRIVTRYSRPLRSEPGPPRRFEPLLERAVRGGARRGGEFDLDALLAKNQRHYDGVDAERRGVVRSMQLMSDEAQALTREIREETASHLQAILDNVKDAIVTVDDAGHIETINPTGERIFGYSAADIVGRRWMYLLPYIASTVPADGSPLLDFLDRCAAKIDDTHVDLAAHQTWGATKERHSRGRGDRGEQGEPQPARRLHRLHSRHHRAQARDAIAAGRAAGVRKDRLERAVAGGARDHCRGTPSSASG